MEKCFQDDNILPLIILSCFMKCTVTFAVLHQDNRHTIEYGRIRHEV
jgi:hypothetical protein